MAACGVVRKRRLWENGEVKDVGDVVNFPDVNVFLYVDERGAYRRACPIYEQFR